LSEIRDNADWRRVFDALGLMRDERRSKIDDWWASSPFAADSDPSFHINDGGWYCFSSGQGGGVLELVQQVHNLDCYAAGRWLLEHGLSHCRRFAEVEGSPAPPPSGEKRTEAPKRAKAPNTPIRQNLVPVLSADHPELQRRGLSAATCAYLGCGAYGEERKGSLAGRIVFQVRGIGEKDGGLQPVVLTHMGRALTDEQEREGGKWHAYGGFHKTLEIYNLDHLMLDDRAVAQTQASGHVLLVEGCFDVAALVEAGILNVGATFGAHLDEDQLPRLKQIAARTRVARFRVWYDRDPAGSSGQQKAVDLINATDALSADGFDWTVAFPSPTRGAVQIPQFLTDPGEFTAEQLRFLRAQRIV
jgi:hypothetical protein